MLNNKEFFLDYMKEYRRKFHQYPERGFEEERTKNTIITELDNMGYENYEVIAKTGISIFIKGEQEGPSILLRADMDALKMKEDNDIDFKSINENMHSCGHDGHMAMLLGVLKYLKELKIKRNIVLLFQPAEEGLGGAEEVLKSGLFNKYEIDSVFGFHLFPDIDQGKIGIASGPIMARSADLNIKIEGKTGHGAMPHTSIDTILATANLINNIQNIISRKMEMNDSGVISIGTINGGQRRNIIADKVLLEGTIRCFSDKAFNIIKTELNNIASGIDNTFGTNTEVEIIEMYPEVNNSKEEFLFLVNEVLEEKDIVNIKPLMISEDFSYLQRESKGVFMFLGTKNEEKGFINPLHNSKFNFDEEVLLKGLEVFLKILHKKGCIDFESK